MIEVLNKGDDFIKLQFFGFLKITFTRGITRFLNKHVIGSIPALHLWGYLNLIMPKKRNKMVFLSIPSFTDNAYAFLEYIVNDNLDYECIWLVANYMDLDKIPELLLKNNIKCYDMRSLSGIFHYLTAKIIIHTHATPIYMSMLKKPKSQFILSIWHGMPIKTLGFTQKNIAEEILNEYKYLGKNSHSIATSEFFKIAMLSCFNMEASRITVTGQPRNDKLFREDSKELLSDILSVTVSDYSKIIFYMPTYKIIKRRDISDILAPFINTFYSDQYDEHKLDQMLKDNNILMVLKPHPFEEEIYNDYLKSIKLENIKPVYTPELVSKNLSLYDILGSADLLITDFSSVYVDYMILNRPSIFLHNTEDEYTNNRGFIFGKDMNKIIMVGDKVSNQKELEEAIINNLNNDPHKPQRENILDLLNFYRDNKSSERVNELIKELIYHK